MLKIVLSAPATISPFCEPARDLRIQNTPLWLWQRNLLAAHVDREIVVPPGSPMPAAPGPALAYRDNLYFDQPYLETFLKEARQRGRPVRAAFRPDDPAFHEHALPLSTSYTRQGDLYLADLWFFPDGPSPDPEPLVIDLQAREIGYYHVPTYMADQQR